MTYLIGILLLVLWVWLLTVLRKAGLVFWRYIAGSCGIFLFLMVFIRPVMTLPLARVVAALSGLIGRVTGFYEAYYRYGVIFIDSLKGSITVNIDLECSGIIEIAAFLSLIVFFSVYTIPERVYIGVIGTMYTLITNAIRITIICVMIHFLGSEYFYIAHTLVGRIVFYLFQVLLYFFIFTRAQIRRMKTGGFGYSKSGKAEGEVADGQ